MPRRPPSSHPIFVPAIAFYLPLSLRASIENVIFSRPCGANCITGFPGRLDDRQSCRKSRNLTFLLVSFLFSFSGGVRLQTTLAYRAQRRFDFGLNFACEPDRAPHAVLKFQKSFLTTTFFWPRSSEPRARNQCLSKHAVIKGGPIKVLAGGVNCLRTCNHGKPHVSRFLRKLWSAPVINSLLPSKAQTTRRRAAPRRGVFASCPKFPG